MNSLLKISSEYREVDPLEEFRVALESAYNSTTRLLSLENQTIDLDAVKLEFKDSYISIESYIGDTNKGITIFIRNVLSIIKKFIGKIKSVVRKAYLYVVTKMMPSNADIFDYNNALSASISNDVFEDVATLLKDNRGNLVMGAYFDSMLFVYGVDKVSLKDKLRVTMSSSATNFEEFKNKYGGNLPANIKSAMVTANKFILVPVRAKGDTITVTLLYKNDKNKDTPMMITGDMTISKGTVDAYNDELAYRMTVLSKKDFDVILEALDDVNNNTYNMVDGKIERSNSKEEIIKLRQYALDMAKLNYQRALAILDINKFKIELAKELIKRREK